MASVLSFTLYQAFFSALGALIFGMLLAMAVIRLPSVIARRLEPILIAPFFMPPLFVVLAITNLYHDTFFGISIFGLTGILIAHWILNIPLVFYLTIRAWRETPNETLYIAQNLNVVFRAVEWPLIRSIAPRAFAIVMLYATLSFTIVLLMGGGPASSTLEIGIYQAIVFSFDIHEAAIYALVQSIIGVTLFFVARGHQTETVPNFGELVTLAAKRPATAWIAVAVIAGFITSPLLFMLVTGIARLPNLFNVLSASQVISATIASLTFAGVVSLVANMFAAFAIWRKIEWTTWLVAAISPLAIAVAVILILRDFVNPFDFGLTITVLLTALTMSPLLVNFWRQAFDSIAIEERQLALLYFTNTHTRMTKFWWPKLQPSAVRNFAIAFILAFGDLALFPVFAPAGYENLAVLVWRLMASYRIDAAIALGVIMLGASIVFLATAMRIAHYVAR